MNLIEEIKYGRVIDKGLFQENKKFYLNELESLENAEAYICSWWNGERRNREWTEIAQNVSGRKLVEVLKSTSGFEDSPWEVILREKDGLEYCLFKYGPGKDIGPGHFNVEIEVVGRVG